MGEPPPEQRLFAGLAGDWTLTRDLPDNGSMTGTARFREFEPAVLHYREDGTLVLPGGRSLEVYREYHYRLEEGQIRICFAEPGPPRTFHVLRLPGSHGAADTASDVHLCGDDVYTGEYSFVDEDQFSVRMRVRGPRKDYESRTVYRRADRA
ncbi:MAG TPA: DUF6314 family protein [Pseudonocardiaceae bacterium]|jgi:hypothetical protein|nr:DUF6314 family protein [Pseudonocardiaceae bacterium]